MNGCSEFLKRSRPMTRILVLCGVLYAMFPVPLYAQARYSLEEAQNYGQQASTRLDPRDDLYTKDRQKQDEYALHHIYILSGVTVLILVGILIIARTGTPLSGREMIRAVVLIFIIYGTVALALIVKTTETLTGVIGLLSAVAGYLFGRAQPESRALISKK